ncbi:hypothetical protein MRX96_019098 [Rhipicephalus microplus]|uniref:Nuclear pore complex protein n=1 Tax=Rhipicephalus microplus TaxID=6941 RepID=A0A9J6CVW0_RHIMP|nr:nuclear pore complex protein Nup107-like [Rhipicephalus microplus]KAH7938626.1 hypothetical protein HPB51_028855 [Rhipicephalus microplus]
MTAVTASVLVTKHPAVIATAGIYADFMEAYKAHTISKDIFKLIDKYASLCDSYLAKVREVTESMISSKDEPVWMEAMACQTLLTEERNTWKLTGALLRDRLKADQFIGESGDNTIFFPGSREVSDKEIVEALIARDSFTRQAILVVDWLESCATHQHGMGNDDDKLEYFADAGCAWKNTLHHVQSHADIGSALSSYVTELDPDAPSRERLPIHELDRDNEFRLFRSIFFHLRAGQLQRAQELAADNGHFWLAAALEGWRPYHDPNNGSILGAKTMQPAEGNLYRDLWKRACWEAASNPTCSRYERAVYGSLCGNVQAMLPACTTWEDQLWARMRAVVDVCVEQGLRTATQQARRLEPLPPGYPSDRGTFEAVFRELQVAVGARETRDQKIMHILQRGVVMDDAVSMVEEIHDWATAQANEPPLLTMRFLAHMVLLLRQIRRLTSTDACSALLCTYIDMLINEGHARLVATYAATLPATDQVAKYSQLAQPQN